MTAMKLHRYPSASGGVAFGKIGAGVSLMKHWTAKDYVQDGLVAMWDGIENAGWGVHNPSLGLCELVSGDVLSITGSVQFESNYISTNGGSEFLGSASAIGLYDAILGDVTIDMLFSPQGFSGGRNEYFNYRLDLSHLLLNVYGTYASGTTYLDNGFQIRASNWNSAGAVVNNVAYTQSDAGRIFRLVGGVANGRVWRTWYKDGHVLSSADNVAGTVTATSPDTYKIFCTSGSLSVRWYTARLYSRALTAAEIAANYAVDKARFNLPDAT